MDMNLHNIHAILSKDREIRNGGSKERWKKNMRYNWRFTVGKDFFFFGAIISVSRLHKSFPRTF